MDKDLLESILKEKKFNLLSIPREFVNVGDVYQYDGKESSPFGNIEYILLPKINDGLSRENKLLA